MKQKWLTRALSLVMIAAFVPSIAMAETYNISDGDVNVRADANGQYVSRGDGQEHTETEATVIIGSSTDHTVTIDAEAHATANVTLRDATIDASGTGNVDGNGHTDPRILGDAGITVTGEGDVNLNIEGNNTVSGGHGHAGVEKTNEGNLTIGSASGEGSLEANGGNNGAGIGGAWWWDPSTSTKDPARANSENITITGGTVTATGGEDGAGIGGGHGGSGTNIKISGGKVTANGGANGAGIGGGTYGTGADIAISGGNVKADSKQLGAAIGGGAGGDGRGISISGDARVEAKGDYNGGAAIGGGGSINGGKGGTGSDISVSGSATVKVSGGQNKYGYGTSGAIGNGSGANAGNPEVEPNVSEDGKVEYYYPDADFNKDGAYKTNPEEKKDDPPKPGTTDPKPGETDPKPGETDPKPGETDPKEDPTKPGETDPKVDPTNPGGTTEPKTDPTTPAQAPTQSGSEAAASTRQAALYQVTDLEGKAIACKAERKDGTLTLTVTADSAILTGTLRGLKTLADEGVKEITLTNGTDSATVTLADLIAKGAPSDIYTLTLQKTPTLTLNGENVAL